MMRNIKHYMVIRIILIIIVFFQFSFNISNSDIFAAENYANLEMGDTSYKNYFNKHMGETRPTEKIGLTYSNINFAESTCSQPTDYEGKQNIIQISEDNTSVKYMFSVQNEGLYNISVNYIQIQNKIKSKITLDLAIDGIRPFSSSGSINLPRLWKEGGQKSIDSRGNELQREPEEKPEWLNMSFYDNEGKSNDPLLFHFTKGSHEISIVFVDAFIAIEEVTIFNGEKAPTYEQIKKEYKEKGYIDTVERPQIIEGENYSIKSDSTIALSFDKSDANVSPNDPQRLILNTIGGLNWQKSGQWIEWEFNVKKTGLYKIAIKAAQRMKNGVFSTRRLYIDDIVPFYECNNIKFNFKNKWYSKILGSDKGDYKFYLEKGKHKLKLEVVPGEFADTSSVLTECIYRLNSIYRNVIMVAGTNPDKYRDYYLDREIPGLVKELKENLNILKVQKEKILKITGKSGSELSSIQSLINQLNIFISEPDNLARKLDSFKSNISGLAAWNNSISEQPLEIDYICLFGKDEKIPKTNAGFFSNLFFELSRVILSFEQDYGVVGNYYENSKAIEVWVSLGRDQLQIIKDLTDNRFVPKYQIKVNVSLVPTGIREAVMAGKGPDVALFVASDEPVNLAIREALVDLSQFESFNSVKERFIPNATLPFEFNKKCYGIPITQNYPMLFVRTDIFRELNLPIPETWDDIYKLAPRLQRKNMEIGIPSSIGMFSTLLYQNGGTFLNEKQTKTNFDSESAIKAFKIWTDFFTKYSFPLQYDFYNRFRTGEMPIGIAPYTMYNMIKVAAPELNGQWTMNKMVGIRNSEGLINRSVCSSEAGSAGLDQGATAAIMLNSVKDKNKAWNFIDWFTSTETQASFGVSIETLMGASARYATANTEAFKLLPWDKEDKLLLMEQWNDLKPVPEIPGNYYITRHLNNAFRRVTYFYENPIHTLNKYNAEMNKEIARKRREFGLDEQKN